jgi:hypothetical protein
VRCLGRLRGRLGLLGHRGLDDRSLGGRDLRRRGLRVGRLLLLDLDGLVLLSGHLQRFDVPNLVGVLHDGAVGSELAHRGDGELQQKSQSDRGVSGRSEGKEDFKTEDTHERLLDPRVAILPALVDERDGLEVGCMGRREGEEQRSAHHVLRKMKGPEERNTYTQSRWT